MMLTLNYENFWEEYPRLVKLLFTPIGSEDGFSESQIAAAENRLNIQFPHFLREFYKRAGLHESSQAHHRVIDTEKIQRTDDGFVEFYEEYEWVFKAYWKLEDAESGNPDPPAYICYEEGKDTEYAPTLSSFFGVMLAQQGSLGRDSEYIEGYGHATREVFECFTADWNCIDIGKRIGAIKEGAAIYYFVPQTPDVQDLLWVGCDSKEDARLMNEHLETEFDLEEDDL